jgi:polyisoprenyl-phosphate glycosyltransferase
MARIIREDDLEPRPNPTLLSFIIPVYNEEEVFLYLRERLVTLAAELPCPVEWIIINDGSSDRTGSLLLDWASEDPRAKVIEFARNFGHQAALTAGLDCAAGDVIVVMDADLQDPPELVHEMLARYREGYDIAFAQRIKRHGEGLFKRASAAAFYWVMKTFIDKDLPQNVGDFRLMSRDAVDALSQMREGQRFMRGMVTWIGFRQIAVPFERAPRAAGETKYSLRKMLRFAWNAILSFSSLPLRAIVYIGILVFLFGTGYGTYAFLRAVIYKDLVPGWATLVILQCVIGGTMLVSLGMIGEYIGRIYDEIKQRPLYIVRRAVNMTSNTKPPRAAISGSQTFINHGGHRDHREY